MQWTKSDNSYEGAAGRIKPGKRGWYWYPPDGRCVQGPFDSLDEAKRAAEQQR